MSQTGIVQMLDVRGDSTPTASLVVNTMGMPVRAMDIAWSGEVMALADGGGLLHVVRASLARVYTCMCDCTFHSHTHTRTCSLRIGRTTACVALLSRGRH